MFFIVNTTKQSISISDLKLILGPRQGIDLDKRYTRDQAENSKGLKSLVSKGLISVKNKTEPEIKSRFIQEVHNHNEFDANQMKKDIMDGVKEIIAANKTEPPIVQQIQQPNIDISELAKMIAGMLPQSSQNTKKDNTDEDVKVNDAILSDIHSRAVNKIVKDVEVSEINYEKEKTDNTIDDNINELENLLLND